MTLIPYEKPFAIMRSGMFRDFFKEGFASSPIIKADVKEKDDGYVVEAEMPGVKKEDVTLICEKDVLTISAKTSAEKTEEKENYVRKERFAGEARRSFVLENIDEENIAAKLEDGVLYVTLPKLKPEKSERKIEIE